MTPGQLAALWPANYRGARGTAMLGRALAHPRISPHWIADTMTVRTTSLVTIGLIVVLSTVIALAAMVVPDINERSIDVVKTVLLSFGGLLTGLLIFLRLETLSSKADEAALRAAIAAEKAEHAARIGENVQDYVTNGGMRANLIQAIRETETDPEITAQRADNAARGVQQDRHETGSREQAAYARGVRDAMRQLEQGPGDGGPS